MSAREKLAPIGAAAALMLPAGTAEAEMIPPAQSATVEGYINKEVEQMQEYGTLMTYIPLPDELVQVKFVDNHRNTARR